MSLIGDIMTLKELCKQKKVSIKELSLKCNLPYSTMNDIINGKKEILNVSLGICLKIASALQISIDELVSINPLGFLQTQDFSVYVKNQSYYINVHTEDTNDVSKICKVNALNTHFIGDMVNAKMQAVYRKEKAEKAWKQITT